MLGPGQLRAPARYRPGRPWPHEPAWFVPHPAARPNVPHEHPASPDRGAHRARSGVPAVSGELVVTPKLAYGSIGKSGAHGFTARQLSRIDEAITLSSRESGLTFSVYVGELAGPDRRDRGQAVRRAGRHRCARPGADRRSRRRSACCRSSPAPSRPRGCPNKSCALAALSMRASFSAGDLTGGIVTGLRMLSDAAGRI